MYICDEFYVPTICMSCVPIVIMELQDDEHAPMIPFEEDPEEHFENKMAEADINLPTLTPEVQAASVPGIPGARETNVEDPDQPEEDPHG